MARNGGSSFSSFLLGGLIGAAIALLTSRRSGEENRQMLVNKGQEVMDKTMDKASTYRDKAMNVANDALNRAGNTVGSVGSKANQVVDKAADKAHQAVNQVSDKARDMTQNQGQNIPNTGQTQWTHEASRDDSGSISDEEVRREKRILEDDIDKTYDL